VETRLGWRSPLTFEQALEASYPKLESGADSRREKVSSRSHPEKRAAR
jgi:hypothetical protein